MFASVLIANRGEIAARIARTLRRLGIRSVVALSPADRLSAAAREADAVALLRGSAAAESYLDGDQIIAAAQAHGCEAIHPGYGFLAENPAFARACAAAGLVFIGPPPEVMELLGDKARARQFAQAQGIPVLPGFDSAGAHADLAAAARALGFPLLIKARAGGGGRGMRVVQAEEELPGLIEVAAREAEAAFGDGGLLLERLLPRARHIEVQVLGDGRGKVIHLWERECSVQRRRQKLIEEAPAPGLPAALRQELTAAAVRLARAAGYVNAGTVEFLVGEPGNGGPDWYFLEVNPRLQVEHPVTEAVTGLDLVELQVRIASGEALPFDQATVRCQGHAIEFRVNAEDPQAGFAPMPGVVRWDPSRRRLEAAGVRIDGGYDDGDRVSGHYDSLVAKVVTWGTNREEALRLALGVPPGLLESPRTTAGLIQAVVRDPDFAAGRVHVEWLEERLPQLLEAAGAPPEAWAAAAAASPWLGADAGAFAGADWVGAGRARLWLTDGWSTRDALEAGSERTGLDLRVADGRVEVQTTGGERWTFWPAWPPAPRRRLEEGAQGSAEVTAPLAGTVAAVPVREGDVVAAGQVLVVLHAMKMEHPVRAVEAGRVAEVAIEAGAQVAAGQVLLRVISGA